MEYVDGLPITKYCDRHKLTIPERLRLFVRVCEGIQDAHQKAVIHRDIKPSNILVSDVDGQPIPKIIDFGVSRAISQEPTDGTALTRLGMILGTPEYMSPEQASTGDCDVDTRTDVYSLGLLLYELVTGVLLTIFAGYRFLKFSARSVTNLRSVQARCSARVEWIWTQRRIAEPRRQPCTKSFEETSISFC
jgi:serine/threonine protein kinase